MKKTSPTELAVVRYIADPVRDEPKNVGVIAWRDGRGAARFLGETDAGDLDGRRVSRLIEDWRAFDQWVTFWRAQLTAANAAPVRKRNGVTAAKFLENLADATRGGFELRLGAQAMVSGEQLDLERTVREAFERLVQSSVIDQPDEDETEGAHHRALAYQAVQALRRRQYRDDRDFVRDYKLTARTREGHDVPAIFDIGIPAQSDDLIATQRLLLADAISLNARTQEVHEVVDRARVIATKATETLKGNESVLVRAIVSNGRSRETEAGRYAMRILQDEARIEPVTVDGFIDLTSKMLQGQL